MLVMPMLLKADVTYLLENTTFDEYDIREWFREFIKVSTPVLKKKQMANKMRKNLNRKALRTGVIN